jgi:hypothetical protein
MEQSEQVTVVKQESRTGTLKSEMGNEDEKENNEADDEANDEENDEENDEKDELEDEQGSSEENEDEGEDSSSTDEMKQVNKIDMIMAGTINVYGDFVAEDGKVYTIAENDRKEKLIQLVDQKVELKGTVTEEGGNLLIIVNEFRKIE